MGTCGHSCETEGIDTIGVYEYDTGSDRVVATHMMKEGVGGDPYPSPDGSEYQYKLLTYRCADIYISIVYSHLINLSSNSNFFRVHHSSRS